VTGVLDLPGQLTRFRTVGGGEGTARSPTGPGVDAGEVGRRAAQLLDRLDPAAGSGHARMLTVPTTVKTYRPLAGS
jgi:hypothetical protein